MMTSHKGNMGPEQKPAVTKDSKSTWYTSAFQTRATFCPPTYLTQKNIPLEDFLDDTIPDKVQGNSWQSYVKEVTVAAFDFDPNSIPICKPAAKTLDSVFKEIAIPTTDFSPQWLFTWGQRMDSVSREDGSENNTIIQFMREIIRRLDKLSMNTESVGKPRMMAIREARGTKLCPLPLNNLERLLSLCRSILAFAKEAGMIAGYTEDTYAVARSSLWTGFLVRYKNSDGVGKEASSIVAHMLEIIQDRIDTVEQPRWDSSTLKKIFSGRMQLKRKGVSRTFVPEEEGRNEQMLIMWTPRNKIRVTVLPFLPGLLHDANAAFTLSCLTKFVFLDGNNGNLTFHPTGACFDPETGTLQHEEAISSSAEALSLHLWPLLPDVALYDHSHTFYTIIELGKYEWTLSRRRSMMVSLGYAWGANTDIRTNFFATPDRWAALPIRTTFLPFQQIGEESIDNVGGIDIFDTPYQRNQLSSLREFVLAYFARSDLSARSDFLERKTNSEGRSYTKYTWTEVRAFFETVKTKRPPRSTLDSTISALTGPKPSNQFEELLSLH